eukprot:maker-scaffold851_size88925-snap-gene-0.24 protein:Tk09229 transcript:maker-scaffold851_size88925-snap-gene-0.24-mRNA-1 annotation:"Chaoptin"
MNGVLSSRLERDLGGRSVGKPPPSPPMVEDDEEELVSFRGEQGELSDPGFFSSTNWGKAHKFPLHITPPQGGMKLPSGGTFAVTIWLTTLLLLSAYIEKVDGALNLDSMLENRHLHSPCNFNPQCLCSAGAAEYGSVLCEGVPLANIPMELQESRVFQLRLRNNDMYNFPEAKLSGSGLWALEVSHNRVSRIPSMAFYGLERALWQLDLSHNKLTQVPSNSISVLRKLSKSGGIPLQSPVN